MRTARAERRAKGQLGPDFPVTLVTLKERSMAKRNAAELAKELAAALAEDNSADVAVVAKRRDYWRQRCGEARGLVRETHKELKNALSILTKLDKDYAAQRKTWIGPKVPPKVVQKPHRSRDGE